jgi:hypothetical protein
MTRLYRSIYGDDLQVFKSSMSGHPFDCSDYETSLLHLAIDIVAADSLSDGLGLLQHRSFTQMLALSLSNEPTRSHWRAQRIHPQNKSNPAWLTDPERTAAIDHIHAIFSARKVDPGAPDTRRELRVSITTRDYSQHEKLRLLALGVHSIPTQMEPRP